MQLLSWNTVNANFVCNNAMQWKLYNDHDILFYFVILILIWFFPFHFLVFLFFFFLFLGLSLLFVIVLHLLLIHLFFFPSSYPPLHRCQRPPLHRQRHFSNTKQSLFSIRFLPSPSLTHPPLMVTPLLTSNPTTTDNDFLRWKRTLPLFLPPWDQSFNHGCLNLQWLHDDCLHQRESLYHEEDVQISVVKICNNYRAMV